VLAEDAIKAALADWKRKQTQDAQPAAEKAAAHE
jgi:hypothetical protein